MKKKSIEMGSLNYKDGKKTLKTIPKKGTALNTCATFNKKYLCCSVQVLNSIQNCPFECSYCFLQNYLNDGSTKAVTDIEALMREVREKTSQEPWRFFRIGTWELGDSLALEKQTGQAARLIHEFAHVKNAVLELKTKSHCVKSLLKLDHLGKTVISWSLNTDDIIKAEEHGTSSLKARLEAMHRVYMSGYPVGIHFDPMILYKGWEKGYIRLVQQVFKAVPAERVAWISIGSLRFNPEMKKKIENNYPDSRLTCAEMVLGDDAKVRYIKPQRLRMYIHLLGELKKYIKEDPLIYLCMERWDVWDRVFGSRPDSIEHLDYIFATSLFERFGLGPEEPQKELYENSDT
jgi:spore photoproduct lyase